jgi:hypothetical protein
MTTVAAPLELLLAAAACAAGVLLLTATDRRVVLASLGSAFIACSALLVGQVPFVVSLALMTSGVAATAILFLSTSASAWPWLSAGAGALPEGRPFRLVLSAFIVVAVVGLSLGINLPGRTVQQPMLATALGLIGLGALQLGLSERSLRVCVGLLTALAGFETLYFVLEPALAIVALLGSVNVVVALIASYLLLVVQPAPPADGPA